MRISDEVLKQVVFDSGDWGSMRELCKNHEQYPVPLLGKTSIGEDIIIEVLSDRIITEVYQENGWVRKNFYSPEECTTEELFQGKWKQSHASQQKKGSWRTIT